MSRRTPLFIDKISITSHIDRALRNHVLMACEAMEVNERLSRRLWPSELLKNYQRAYTMSLGGGEELAIQLDPRRDSRDQKTGTSRHRFLRLEWTPHYVTAGCPSAFLPLHEFLVDAIPCFELGAFLETMNITRIDISFDVRGVHVNGLEISALLRRNFTGHYVNGPHGLRNAVYLGQPTSDQYLLVYDKNLEEKKRQNGSIGEWPLNQMRRGKPVPRSRTRFELRLRDVGSLGRLFGMSNPFDRYEVREFFNVERAMRGHVMEWFLDSCRVRGVQAALSRVEDPRQRARYAQAVRETRPPAWWNTDQLWGELAEAVQRTFYLQ